MEVTPFFHLVGNRHCKSLKSMGYEEENYDYIVLDGDASMTDTIKNILENEIRLVVVPVNFLANAVENTGDLFETLNRLNALHDPVQTPANQSDLSRKRQAIRSVASQMLIVPLAADEKKLDQLLKQHRVKTMVKTYKNMSRMEEETKQSLEEGVLVWEIDGLSKNKKAAVRRYFQELAVKIRRYFD
jgi:cellulose biosynthesis protein BcsQ